MPSNNKIQLNVELKTQVKNTKELYKEIGKTDGFNSNGIKSSLKTISKLENATELTAEEYKKLCGAIQKVTNSLVNFLSSTGKLSESAIELKKKIDDQITSIKNITKNQKNNDKAAQERKTTLSEKIGTKTIHIIDKDGRLGKDKLSEEEIATKLSKGEKIGYTDDKGGVKEVTADSDIGKAALAYNETIEKANQLSIAFENATRIMMDYSTKLRDQMGQDLGVKLEKAPETPRIEVKESPKESSKEEVNEELKDVVKSFSDQLKENLTQLIEATKGLNLTEQQLTGVNKHTKGAELALEAEDWKEFQKHFNSILRIFKDAASESENLSEAIQKLTSKQSRLSQEINALETTKTTLKNKLTEDRTGFNKTGLKEFTEKNEDAKKVLLSDGTRATHEQILEIQEAVNKYLASAGKTLAQLKQADIEAINQEYGTNIKDRNSAFASIRYERAFSQEPGKIASEIEKTDEKIASKTEELNSIKNQLENVNTAAQNGADAINKLYIQINNLADSTNKAITAELNKQSEKNVDKTPAAVSTSGTGDSVKPIKEQASSLGKAFKQFTIYATAVRLAKRALREAVSTVKELDKELTEQAMVTGLTREQTYKLVKSYQDLAQQTGATTKEIAGVATEYMKQGKSIQEAMTLTEAAVSAAKVARVSTADSVNYLTTALNGFQLSANDAMLVSDKFAAVAAASATDYDELAIALSKVASQANLAGMSIDYTTALLTKGLETTREAPETMGTALKTIIARMRELGDYGETLEGDIDINNVETQLGYVGIALRNTAGELRSTEDVLDELGKKWTTLDKNQQAAVAKALAGTRQQSRLIAMMTDYERVTELQEIAQRSAGTTAAQAGVYLEGIEAALNKITIAWEKIVTAVTSSEWIISLLEGAGNLLDNIGAALEDETASMMMLIPLAVSIVASMIKKHEMQKRQNRAILQEENSKRQQVILDKEGALAKKKQYLNALKILAKERGITEEKAQQALVDDDKTNDAKAAYVLSEQELEAVKEDAALKAEIRAVEGEIKQEELEIRDLKLEQAQTDMEIAANGPGILGILGGVLGFLTPILTIMQLINGASLMFAAIKAKEPSLYAKSTAAAKKETAEKSKGMFAGIVSAFSSLGPWGIAAGIILAIGLVAALGVGIAAVAGAWNEKDQTNEDAKKINTLSNEIYKLQEKANAINQITTSFDDLDNKIIQTNKDMEEMNSLLEQAGDKLSDEIGKDEDIGYGKGVSEKEHYQGLVGNKAKRDFLEQVETQARIEAKNKRDEQINLFRNNAELMNANTTDAEVKKAQTSIYANAIYNLQDYIDKLKETEGVSTETASAIEEMTQAMIEEASLNTALDFADYEDQVADLVNQVKDLEVSVKDTNGELKDISAAEILTSDDYGIRDKANAFNELKQTLGESSEEYELLAAAYKDYEIFAEMGDDVLKMVEHLELSIEDINQLGKSYKTLKSYGLDMSEEAFKNSITGANGVLSTLAKTGGDVESTVKQVFRTVLSSADDYEKTYNAIINSLSSVLSRGMLNMGQDVTKLKNTVNGFYEKATEWQSMTASEQSEFMSENAYLFEGKNGEELLAALESGDFKEMERLLKESDAMQKQIEDTLKWIDTELSVEEAKIGDARNEAYINQLKKWRSQVEDQTNFFRADLEFLIEQEQAQLDIYKDFLEKQQEQLEEALDKRKQAYEDYFEAINQQQEDDDYQEQSDKLVANLSKLSTSTDMASKKQAKELEQQLEELEKERQQTLRERAQEAVINSIDQEVEDINDKFDKLLDNSQLLLEAMRGEVNSNPQFWTELMASARESGMTSLQLEEFGNEILSAFGSDMMNVDMKEIQEIITNNATINIGDRTYDLNSDDGDAFWNLLQAIISKNGYS